MFGPFGGFVVNKKKSKSYFLSCSLCNDGLRERHKYILAQTARPLFTHLWIWHISIILVTFVAVHSMSSPHISVMMMYVFVGSVCLLLDLQRK